MGQETIVAVSTPTGRGGIAVIRMSGPDAVAVLKRSWSGADPGQFKSHSLHLGWIMDAAGDEIDQVVASYFRAPNSYTGEDVIELSCHGSPWIQNAVVTRLMECGARAAQPGEFTRRAFENGRLDLAQAEGVADLISASSRASAKLAATQLKGDFSRRLEGLRRGLLDLGVLLELELDFSEEDVEFADRARLISLARETLQVVSGLCSSFKAGNAFKTGIPIAIAGIPNVGKSTLLNALSGEDKAIVSDIPGTTRDAIEDTVEIAGILFRFTDTAGLRESEDQIERIGVERARKKIWDASILLYLIDPTQDVSMQLDILNREGFSGKRIVVITKSDISNSLIDGGYIAISAKEGIGMDSLKKELVKLATEEFNPDSELIVTNARHYEALRKAEAPLTRLIDGLGNGLSADFLAQDLREAERYLAEITGAVTSTDILHSIFARYCIGK